MKAICLLIFVLLMIGCKEKEQSSKNRVVFPDVSASFPSLKKAGELESESVKEVVFQNSEYTADFILEEFSQYLGPDWKLVEYEYTDKRIEVLSARANDLSLSAGIRGIAQERIEELSARYHTTRGKLGA